MREEERKPHFTSIAREERELDFTSIARDLESPILRYLERYVGDRAVAEDLWQATLLRIDRGLPFFRGRSSIKTWAFSIASRVAADYCREPARQAHLVELNEEEVVDPGRTIDEGFVVDEMNACVRQVIDSLPDTFRAALVLHDLEGMSAEETAAICDCSVATAKIRIHRARSRLRDALNQQCDFYHDSDEVLRCDRKALTAGDVQGVVVRNTRSRDKGSQH